MTASKSKPAKPLLAVNLRSRFLLYGAGATLVAVLLMFLYIQNKTEDFVFSQIKEQYFEEAVALAHVFGTLDNPEDVQSMAASYLSYREGKEQFSSGSPMIVVETSNGEVWCVGCPANGVNQILMDSSPITGMVRQQVIRFSDSPIRYLDTHTGITTGTLSPGELHYVEPFEEKMNSARGWTLTLLPVIFLLLILLLAFMGLYLHQVVITPIAKIIQADLDLASGMPVQPIVISKASRYTEIDRLVSTRENMLRSLRGLEKLGESLLYSRNPAAVYQVLGSQLKDTFEANWGIFWRREGNYFVVHAVFGAAQLQLIGRGILITGFQCEASGQIAFVENSLLNEITQWQPGLFSFDQYILCVPTPGQEEDSRVLLAREDQPFSVGDRDLLKTMLNTSGVALERLRLFDSQRIQADWLGKLTNATSSLVSQPDLDHTLPTLTRHLSEITGLPVAMIFSVDNARKNLVLRSQFGLSDELLGTVIPCDHPQIAAYLADRLPLALPDAVQQFPNLWNHLQMETPALLALPLIQQDDKLSGVLAFAAPELPELDADQQALYETLAFVAGGVINNAARFMEVDIQRRRMMLAAEIGQQVSVLHDSASLMFEQVCTALHEQLEYQTILLFLKQPEEQELIMTAWAGENISEEKIRSLRIQIESPSIPAWVVRSQQAYLCLDSQNDPHYTDIPGLPNAYSEMAVPVFKEGLVAGVLDIQSDYAYAFDQDDLLLLQIVARQIGIALDNIQHHNLVQKQARLDSLTQVYNHGYFLQALREQVQKATEEKSSLSVIMLDIDNFKNYNDQYGHIAGDAALLTTVQAIRTHVKSGDLVGRWGGEEFVIALIGATKLQTMEVAERIRETLRALVPMDEKGRKMPSPTVSQGIAIFGKDGDYAIELIDRSDQALYQAKESGRDQVKTAS